MNKKLLHFGLFLTFSFSLIFGYSLVFAGNTDEIFYKQSDYIFPESIGLNKVRFIIKSRIDFSNSVIKSDCDFSSEFIMKNKNYYVFDLSLSDLSCDKEKVDLYFLKDDLSIKTYLNIYKKSDLYMMFLDFSDLKISNYIYSLNSKIDNNSLKTQESYLNKFSLERKKTEGEYFIKILEDIIFKRKQLYIIPVDGGQISTNINKLPNALRPYRDSYTDGIHHGWDIDSYLGANVVALDDGIIIRVVDGFKYSDLNHIVYGNDISEEQKFLNLDILRGNQVWLKTMKGDVVFYSHLDEIYSNIKNGEFLRKGEPVGTVGSTGVPEKGYNDYHLHFPIHKNPRSETIKKYSFLDIMKWDWYFKEESPQYILENQYKLFQK